MNRYYIISFLLVGNSLLLAQSDLFEWTLSASLDAGQAVSALAFSPDGSKSAIGTIDGTVQILDLVSKPYSLRKLAKHSSRVVFVGFTADSSLLISAGEDGGVLISPPVAGAARTLRVKAKLRSLAVSRDSALLASGAYDRTVTLWDLQTGRQLSQLQHHGKRPFVTLGFGDKDASLIGVSESGVICQWDVKTGALLRPMMQDPDQMVYASSIGDSGELLSIGTEAADFLKGPLNQLNTARAPDINREDRIKIYELGRGTLAKTLDGINGSVTGLTLSADGRFIGAVRQRLKDSFVAVYDAKRGVEVASSRLPANGSAVSFSHQGDWLGVATARGEVLVWAVKGIGIPVTVSDLRGGRFNITTKNAEPLVAPPRPLVLAVMDFDANGTDAPSGRAVAEMIRTRLGEAQNVTIVERTRMEQIMKEQNFQYSDRVDEATAVTLGQMLGASKMVFGSVSKLETKFTINVRMVDVKTGVINGEREVTCQPCGTGDLQEAVIVLRRVLVK